MYTDADRVRRALEDEKWDWRTLKGIVNDTHLSEETVLKLLLAMDDLIQSSVPDKNGNALYTTRSHYNRKYGLYHKFLNSLTGSINP